jgi:hypothetical protein
LAISWSQAEYLLTNTKKKKKKKKKPVHPIGGIETDDLKMSMT